MHNFLLPISTLWKVSLCYFALKNFPESAIIAIYKDRRGFYALFPSGKDHLPMHLKKLFALFLSFLLLLSLCACEKSPDEIPLPENDNLVIQQDTAAELFNAAVDKLISIGNYRMTGSISSIAEIHRGESTKTSDDIDLDPPTVVVTNFDCAYDMGKMTLDCPDGTFPHSTYFDGSNYYHIATYSGVKSKFFTPDPSFEDHDAAKYLKRVNAEMIFSPGIVENGDGTTQISFTIPFAFYKSEALIDWLGIVVDEGHESEYVSVKATLDSDGNFAAAYLSFATLTQFGDEVIDQELLVSLRFSDFGSTQIVVPADLAEYEDWTEEEYIPESTAPMESLSPEDLQ